MKILTKKRIISSTPHASGPNIHFREWRALLICFGMFFALMNTAFGGQGVQRMLYTVPNTTFIEKSGETNVVTINDASGSISTLQSSIDSTRSANPNVIIVINLQRGTTYTVSGTGLTLGSRESLVAGGAIIQAADSSVTVPLIQIASGSTNVSVSGGTLDGANANINGIYAPAAARVNVDQVTVKNCGQDCILLKGNGNTTYNNEMTVTRCDCSGSAAHAGISIQNSTQTAVLDNYCHNNLIGIYLSCAWADVANNTCNYNTTGIDIAGGDDNVLANNTCNGNGTGIIAGASNNMIDSNFADGNSTAGISSTGSGNIFADNLFGPGNGVNFSGGSSSDKVVAYEAPLSVSSGDYFYPPLIDNQHSDGIVNGMGRTDLTIGSTTIDDVQNQYNSARSANPNNVIVLHLTGNYTVGATPLTLYANTCVLLSGTVQINSSTTAHTAITNAPAATHVSISGGTIDGGSLTAHNGICMFGTSMVQIDGVTLQNFGASGTRVGGSDVIHCSGGSSPYIVTRCYINGGAARGIWLQLSGQKSLISDNEVTDVNMDGVDCDSSTKGAVVKFNYCHNLVRYGVFIEQSANHDLVLGNICNNDSRDINLYNNSTTPRAATAYNSVLANWCLGSNGMRNGSTGDGTNVVTSDNFIFNNVIVSASVSSEQYGWENYYSQNYLRSASLSTSGSEVFFNSPDVDGNLQVRDSNSGLGVIVQGASLNNNAAIVTATPSAMGNGTGDDEWQFVPTTSGFYQVVNKNSGLAMVVQGASTAAGAPIIQYAYSSDTTYNDEWLIQPVGNGLYNFVSRNSALYLDVPGGSTTPGTQLDQWQSTDSANQQFILAQDTPASSPDFSLSATPSSQIVSAGNGTSYTVTLSPLNGFSGTVGLTVSGLPQGATASFNPTSITGSGNSTLSVSTSTNTPGGSYTLIITGTSGSLQHSTSVTLAISDFSVSVTPSSQTVSAGNAVDYTVNVGSLNGFAGTVSLTASGLPSGATATFNPASIDSAGSSTLTITTSTSTPVGTSTLTITGTSGTVAHSTNVLLTVGGALPTPWTDADIGSPAVAGSASYAGGTFTVSGNGSDIWNAADQFNYVYLSNNGDTTVIARVVTENGTQSYAKAGVMIRETTATNAVEASVLLTPANGVALEIRPATGASSINVANWVTGPAPPQWVKLARSGNTFTASYSADGSTWTQFAATNVTMAPSTIVGLAVTSHDTNTLNTATFDNVQVTVNTNPPPVPTGLTTTAGNAQVALSWTVSSGATSYNVKRSTTSGGPYTTIAGISSTGYTDTNVVNGTTYYYVVSAVNGNGESANSSEVSATPQAPQAPAAPTNLSASGAKRKVTLTWTQSVSPGIASNKVYRSSTSGGPYTLLTTLSATTSYTDSGLRSGTTYYYVVTAVDGNGQESPYSNQATGTAK